MRVVDLTTEATVELAGRVFDNITRTTADELVALLERRDAQKRDTVERAFERNDLIAILEQNRTERR